MDSILRRLQKFPHAPNVIGDTSSHSGRRSERAVDAPEVVPPIPEHDRSAVVFPLLAEAIRQPGKTAKAQKRTATAARITGMEA
jgi:hypothetical protein